jgi:hypothetical protein
MFHQQKFGTYPKTRNILKYLPFTLREKHPTLSSVFHHTPGAQCIMTPASRALVPLKDGDTPHSGFPFTG